MVMVVMLWPFVQETHIPRHVIRAICIAANTRHGIRISKNKERRNSMSCDHPHRTQIGMFRIAMRRVLMFRVQIRKMGICRW
jgi:hypothetical protein